MTKRLSGPERRASIIQAAKCLFAEQGFHAISVDEIVKAVGVSPAVLYRHFDSKDALYEAVLSEFASRREDYVDTIVKSDNSFAGVLRGITRIYARSIAGEPDLLRMELHALLDGRGATQAFFKYRWKTFTDFIEFGLEGPHAETNRSPVDGRTAGLMFLGMLREALTDKYLKTESRMRNTALDELVDAVVDFFLAAVGIAPGPQRKGESI